MQFPRLGVLAGVGPALLLGCLLPGLAMSATPQSVDRAPAQKAPQFKAGNAPGTKAPVYNQQRTGSTDPVAVAARNSPTPAAPQTRPNSVKAKPVQPAGYSANEPRYLDEASDPAPIHAAQRYQVQHRDERVAPAAHPQWIDDPTMYDQGPGPEGCATCGPAGCDTGSCGGLSDCVPCNYFAQNGWYIGGEYLNARANFSDPAAILVRTVANGGLDFHDQVVPYDTGYQSAFRVNAGYRWVRAVSRSTFRTSILMTMRMSIRPW